MLFVDLGYEQLPGLAVNLASTNQTENPRGFSEVGESKQLTIATVVHSNFKVICIFRHHLLNIILLKPTFC